MIGRFDGYALGLADRFVLWVWNRFEVPRQSLLRVALLTWLSLSWISPVYQKGYLGVGGFISLFCILIIMTLEEVLNARLPKDVQNARQLALREVFYVRIFRWYLHVWMFIFEPLFVILAVDGVLDVVHSASSYVALMLLYSLVPTDPPKRKREREESPNVVPDLA